MNTSTKPTIVAISVAAIANSSTLAGYGYDEPTKTLQVDFLENLENVYQYAPVSPETFAAFTEAESKGSFFYKHIKGRVAYTRFERATGDVTKTWAPTEAGAETEQHAA